MASKSLNNSIAKENLNFKMRNNGNICFKISKTSFIEILRFKTFDFVSNCYFKYKYDKKYQ